MKRLFLFAALALIGTVGAIFMGVPGAKISDTPAEPQIAPAASASYSRAPASVSAPAKASAAVTPVAEIKKALDTAKACYHAENCNYPNTDPHSYSFAVGKKISKLLGEMGAAYRADPALENEAENAAREYMTFEDGFVQEQAIKLFAQLPPNPANVTAMITGLTNSPDPLLVEQAMTEMERYIGTAEEARIQDFLSEFIAHGGQFSSEKASQMIQAFLNERSVPTFEEKLASMVPESTPAKYLRAALAQYRMQQQGG